MDMRKYEFDIVGLSPLLTHTAEHMGKTRPGQVGRKNIPTPEAEAKAGLYLNKNGDFCIPAIAFRAGLLYACRGKRIGKVGAAAIMAACVQGNDDRPVLVDPKTHKPLKKYAIDRRRAVVQRQGVMRCRPRFDRWACIVMLEVDMDVVENISVVVDLLNEAGIVAGAGDYRPERKGWFGKYTVKGAREAK